MQIANMKKVHLVDSDTKLKWWGYGEWVEEPDEMSFEYAGFKCLARRNFDRNWIDIPKEAEFIEGVGGPFGGNWCGYVVIPPDHEFFEKDYLDINIDVHQGLTFSGRFDSSEYMIGFDCAHLYDIIPSTLFLERYIESNYEKSELFKKMSELKRISQELKSRLSYADPTTYKNENFVINEIKSLAEQCAGIKVEDE